MLQLEGFHDAADGGGGGQGLILHLFLDGGEELLDARVAEELVVEFFLDHGVHPRDGLLFAAGGVGAGPAGGRGEFFDGLPEGGEGFGNEGGAGGAAGCPAGGGGLEVVQDALVSGAGEFGALDVVAVGFVDCQQVGDLDDALLHALELVSGTGDHDEQEKIDHGSNGDFVLSHADGFHEDDIITGGLAEQHGLAALAADTAERAAGGRGADVGVRLADEVLHAGFIAEDAAAGDAAAGVHGEHGDAFPTLTKLAAERLDERAFPGSGDAGDADADGVSGVRQQAGEEFLGEGLVRGVVAFHQGDGAREDADVAGEHALLILVERELGAFRGFAFHGQAVLGYEMEESSAG